MSAGYVSECIGKVHIVIHLLNKQIASKKGSLYVLFDQLVLIKLYDDLLVFFLLPDREFFSSFLSPGDGLIPGHVSFFHESLKIAKSFHVLSRRLPVFPERPLYVHQFLILRLSDHKIHCLFLHIHYTIIHDNTLHTNTYYLT